MLLALVSRCNQAALLQGKPDMGEGAQTQTWKLKASDLQIRRNSSEEQTPRHEQVPDL